MQMVVVGGNSREVGKTSVVAGLIRALRHRNWTAIKLTQFGHGICSLDSEPCDCAPGEHPFVIQEEHDRSGNSDTSRFLEAGARRSLWVRVRQGMLEAAIPDLRQAIAGEENIIWESNSILHFFQPDLYLTVLDPAKKDFKDSARHFLDRADASLVMDPGLEHSLWEGVSLKIVRSKPVFSIRKGCYVTPEITDFVESRLLASDHSPTLRG